MPTNPSGPLDNQPHHHLDGRTLEGGGQLARIALAISSLTGQSLRIDHIRGNRTPKTGLKNSHLAAIQYLAEVSGSIVSGAEVGSSSLTFYPHPGQNHGTLNQEINIRIPTAGSIFLVFQALYPYLLYAGGNAVVSPSQPIRMSITGGTNVSFSPSYDYVSQVLVPNLSRVGLPHLSIHVEKRGWGTGPISLGKVTFSIEPLSKGKESSSPYRFPSINLNQYRRGKITQIDITVLAPDTSLMAGASRSARTNQSIDRNKDNRKPGQYHRQSNQGRNESDNNDEPQTTTVTTRQFIENETIRILEKRLRKLPVSVLEPSTRASLNPGTGLDSSLQTGNEQSIVPINVHTTEATHHFSQLYILIVAHTSNGFKLGHDALHGAQKGDSPQKTSGNRGDRGGKRGQTEGPNMMGIATRAIERCVDGFIQELYDPHLQNTSEKHQPCVDEYMRDQLVVFEALGQKSTIDGAEVEMQKEDERYFSLHTQTARWVCEEMLGIEW